MAARFRQVTVLCQKILDLALQLPIWLSIVSGQ